MAGSITPYETAAGKRYRVRYRKPDKSQTDKRGFKTKKEAQLFLASVTVSKATGEYIDPNRGRDTLGSFHQSWVHERLAPLKPSSRTAMETAWRVHVEPQYGNRAVAGITRDEIAEWVAKLNLTLGAQTVRRIIFVLSGHLTIAVRKRAIQESPTAGVVLPKKRKKPIRYLTHEQVATLAGAAGESKRLIVELLAYTGLRWGEAAALRIRHLNMLRKRITIEENAVLVNGAYAIGTPKNGETRIVPMPPHLVKRLEQTARGKGPDSFLFSDIDVPMPYPHATSGWFVKAVTAAQALDKTIPTITPHDLRHTAASLAVSAGANVKAVQRMLGHASAAMTLDVYADLFDDDLDAVAAAMSAARTAAVS